LSNHLIPRLVGSRFSHAAVTNNESVACLQLYSISLSRAERWFKPLHLVKALLQRQFLHLYFF